MRTGIIAKKLGMTRIFQEDGRSLPVTILSVDSVKVTGNKVIDTDGYTALQLGIGVRKNQRVNKSWHLTKIVILELVIPGLAVRNLKLQL